jgi:hypothetical protein
MKFSEHERQAVSALLHIARMREAAIERLFIVGPARLFIRHLRTSAPSEPRDPAAEAAAYFEAHRDDLIHVLDWLTSSVHERHDWLSNVDELGRPKKLLKAGDLKVLVHEADKAEARLHQRDPHYRSMTSKDETFVVELGAGYTLVRLLSPDALDLESDRMRHCIGHGSYDEDLAHGSSAFYSVRDEDGMPRATLEIVPREVDGTMYGHIRQFRGRRNANPEAHVVDLVGGIKVAMKWLDGPRTKSQVPEMATDQDIANAFLRGGNLR